MRFSHLHAASTSISITKPRLSSRRRTALRRGISGHAKIDAADDIIRQNAALITEYLILLNVWTLLTASVDDVTQYPRSSPSRSSPKCNHSNQPALSSSVLKVFYSCTVAVVVAFKSTSFNGLSRGKSAVTTSIVIPKCPRRTAYHHNNCWLQVGIFRTSFKSINGKLSLTGHILRNF